MRETQTAPGFAQRGGRNKHHNFRDILQQQIEQDKSWRQKTLGTFRRRMADRIRAAEAAGSPLLGDLVRFRATQLNEWQSDLPQIRAGERFSPGRGMSRLRGGAAL